MSASTPESVETKVQPPIHRPASNRRVLAFAVTALLLCAAFIGPLSHWVSFALGKERDSYLLLVPPITAYLIWTRRPRPTGAYKTSVPLASAALGLGVAAISCIALLSNPGDQLSLQIFAFLCLLASAAFIFIGANLLRQITFPVVFLLFAVPVPPTFEDYIEIFLQHGSADAAYAMLSLSGIPMVRDGLAFTFPNLAIRVAQECSGYNSSFALFLVSTLAGYLFLTKAWTKTALCVAVIPLALLRNGFRITVLSLLSVYDDPKWIDSPLHHRGGPIWFALSLIPFLALLFWLRKMDSRAINQKNSSDD